MRTHIMRVHVSAFTVNLTSFLSHEIHSISCQKISDYFIIMLWMGLFLQNKPKPRKYLITFSTCDFSISYCSINVLRVFHNSSKGLWFFKFKFKYFQRFELFELFKLFEQFELFERFGAFERYELFERYKCFKQFPYPFWTNSTLALEGI